MKKVLLSAMAVFMLLSATYAKVVDISVAMQAAQNFYSEATGKNLPLSLAYQCNNADASNGVAVDEPLYYAFNVGDEKGFVIVAADDVVKPILGYDLQGHFSISAAPPVITGWLTKYGNQIAFAKVNVNKLSGLATAYSQWNKYVYGIGNNTKQLRASNAVGPLLTTTWDQGQYYNDLCPTDGNSPQGFNGRVPTGCGATAMSQIMRYWGYPATGTGSHTYNSGYGSLSANFGATTYNWANMPNSVTSTNNDVATIMYQCGVAVEMDYQSQVSLSYMIGQAPSCQDAYVTYFGYDGTSIQGLQKANYNDASWASMIDNELANNRPIQYAGSGPDGGHTFVLDGSDGNGNYHINWGWSGIDNGFYSVNNLAPTPYPNSNFNSNESMIIGIKPLNTTVVTPSGIDLYAAITVTPNPVAFLQNFTVTTNLINDGGTAFDGSYCAALFDVNGNFIRIIGAILSTGSSPLNPGYYYNGGLTFTDTSTAVTVPGTYEVGIFYKGSTSNNWLLAGASTFTNPVQIQITGPQDQINLYSAISANPATLQQGQSATISVNLTNAGTATYYGTYEAVLLDMYGQYVETIGTYNETQGLPVNYSYNTPLQFSSNYIQAPEGQYILAIAENVSGTSNWYYCGGQTYSNPVLINVVNPGINFLAVNETTANALAVYPNPASDHVTIDAGNLEGNYTLKLFDAVGKQVYETFGVLNSQTINVNTNGYAAGVYFVQLKTNTATLTSKFVAK